MTIFGLAISEVLAIIFGVLAFIYRTLNKHKDDISAIIKRVEADSKDGWTRREKLDLFWSIFEVKVYPKLPWYIRLIPKGLIRGKVESIFDSIFGKAENLKD
jgi:hypothetical protein